MAADQQFCLRWNNHQSTLVSVFDSLLEKETLVDCTLAAEGQYLKAHKVVLCACSPYLETLLSQHYEKHPIVILKDVKFTELKSMMDYMYRGEVNISQDQLGTFLKAAESLQIKGLSENGEGDARDVGSTTKPPPRKPPATPAAQPELAQSPAHRSRDGSVSPSSRKRRRLRRNSDDGDNHLDSNSCDLPVQAQSTPVVPNIPASITTTPIRTPIVKPEVNDRLDHNSLPPESGLLKEKIEPAEPLLEPKTEYLEDLNNDDSVEDLTLDDDDEMDMSQMSNMSNMSRPGPSHGADISNQGFTPWQLGNQSGTDEVFMAAQEAVNAHRDSQVESFMFASCGSAQDIDFLYTYESNTNLPNQQNLYTEEDIPFEDFRETFPLQTNESFNSLDVFERKRPRYPIWSPSKIRPIALDKGKSAAHLSMFVSKQLASQMNKSGQGKRGRGRPRINLPTLGPKPKSQAKRTKGSANKLKTSTPKPTNVAGSSSQNANPTKRGRGRPRKDLPKSKTITKRSCSSLPSGFYEEKSLQFFNQQRSLEHAFTPDQNKSSKIKPEHSSANDDMPERNGWDVTEQNSDHSYDTDQENNNTNTSKTQNEIAQDNSCYIKLERLSTSSLGNSSNHNVAAHFKLQEARVKLVDIFPQSLKNRLRRKSNKKSKKKKSRLSTLRASWTDSDSSSVEEKIQSLVKTMKKELDYDSSKTGSLRK